MNNATETILKQTIDMMNSKYATINQLLNDCTDLAVEIAKRAIDNEVRQNRFNIFELSSRIHKDENFHSDIIAFLLNPLESHGLGHKPLHLFIDLLNRRRPSNALISKESFKNVEVVREHGRIDILIQNTNSKECIIIENKIKWAGDQPKQLYKYYTNTKTKTGDNVKAIVYLTPHSSKHPQDQTFGTDKTIAQEIRDKLITIVTYPKAPNDTDNLSYGWLMPVLTYATSFNESINVISFIQQYLILLEKEREAFMSNREILKFLEIIGNDEQKLDAAIAIRDMFWANDCRGNLFRDKIIDDLRGRNNILSQDAEASRDSVYIHLFGLTFDGQDDLNCELKLCHRKDGRYQTIELWPHSNMDGELLLKMVDALKLDNFHQIRDNSHLYYNGWEGIQYFNNETAFYETVERIANTIFTLMPKRESS